LLLKLFQYVSHFSFAELSAPAIVDQSGKSKC